MKPWINRRSENRHFAWPVSPRRGNHTGGSAEVCLGPTSSVFSGSRFILMRPFHRIAVFIDGTNLHLTTRALGFEIDYRKLLAELQSRGKLLRASYYKAIVEEQEYSS